VPVDTQSKLSAQKFDFTTAQIRSGLHVMCASVY